MMDNKGNFEDEAAMQSEDVSGRKHERSTIAFPYSDLDTAVEVAMALYNRSGHGGCGLDELAAELNQTLSGAFRVKIGTAKTFGLIEKDGRSTFRLTELGRKLTTPTGERAARVEAFLAVPLYDAIYQKYRGHFLPPRRALEREMEALGVSGKQTDKARHAFERSARQAGFFESGDDRLVKPRVESGSESPSEVGHTPPEEPARDETSDLPTRHVSGGADNLHPFIEGLLQSLPEPGSQWSAEDRASWLQAAAYIFKLIYKGDGTVEIKAPSRKQNSDENTA